MAITTEICLNRIKKNKITLNLSPESITEADLLDVIIPFLKEHPEITHVALDNFNPLLTKTITYAGLKALLEVKSLTSLNLSRNVISPECATALEYSTLSELDISLCHFTDDMLDSLNHNEYLRKLNVSAYIEDNKITALGILTLSTLPNLISLALDGSTPGIEGCATLAKEMKLECLNLNSCGITPDMMSAFRDNESLTELSLYSNPITDAGMVVIPSMKKLNKLVACSTELTDVATIYFADSRSLTDVDIFGQDEGHISVIETVSQLDPGPFIGYQSRRLTEEENAAITAEEIKDHVEQTHANVITEDGQRILASNANLAECAIYFIQSHASGYFSRWEDLDESPIQKLNFGREKGANPPMPSLVKIGLFNLKDVMKKNPSAFPESTIQELETKFKKEIDPIERRSPGH